MFHNAADPFRSISSAGFLPETEYLVLFLLYFFPLQLLPLASPYLHLIGDFSQSFDLLHIGAQRVSVVGGCTYAHGRPPDRVRC